MISNIFRILDKNLVLVNLICTYFHATHASVGWTSPYRTVLMVSSPDFIRAESEHNVFDQADSFAMV